MTQQFIDGSILKLKGGQQRSLLEADVVAAIAIIFGRRLDQLDADRFPVGGRLHGPSRFEAVFHGQRYTPQNRDTFPKRLYWAKCLPLRGRQKSEIFFLAHVIPRRVRMIRLVEQKLLPGPFLLGHLPFRAE